MSLAKGRTIVGSEANLSLPARLPEHRASVAVLGARFGLACGRDAIVLSPVLRLVAICQKNQLMTERRDGKATQ
jgi:hypothetical protein